MEKLKLCNAMIVLVVVDISLGSLDNLDPRWKVFCDDPWFENCRNLGVLWKCEKFDQCIEIWQNNSADYNEYFLDQLNSTIDRVFDIDGKLNNEFLPLIEYNIIKIDTAIHSARNPFVTYPSIDEDRETTDN